jgi:GNAT superfamily N-acetyltransferase
MRTFRLLVISNETVESRLLHEAVGRIADGRRAQVTVVAPALNGRFRHWCSDDDGARHAAQSRLDYCLDRLHERGVNAAGWVGDADPVVAIEDALRHGNADELLIATHPEGRSNWLAHDLVERAAVQFGLPTAHLVATGDRELLAA